MLWKAECQAHILLKRWYMKMTSLLSPSKFTWRIYRPKHCHVFVACVWQHILVKRSLANKRTIKLS